MKDKILKIFLNTAIKAAKEAGRISLEKFDKEKTLVIKKDVPDSWNVRCKNIKKKKNK